jgi:Fic family protein
MLEMLIAEIEQKKVELDLLRRRQGQALAQLQKSTDVELTYTANAIEGNTLTLRETAEVIAAAPDRRLARRLSQSGKNSPLTPAAAFEAHYRLAAIHPFSDGNGRTARLLMNLLLIRSGYPPIAVRPEDRKAYLDSLERASLAEDMVPFQTLMHQRLDATLSDYLAALREALPPP